jgi:ribosomal protein S27AE
MPESKMICPRCDAEMNLHAEKIDYTAQDAALAQDDDDGAGGVLMEIHTCPACGDIETRREDERGMMKEE